jgi:hypothetical protein
MCSVLLITVGIELSNDVADRAGYARWFRMTIPVWTPAAPEKPDRSF